MNKYIIKSEGIFNIPYIESKTLGIYNGFKPLFEGGCFAIIPHNNKFILFGEDDDNYWEEEIITKEELLDLQKIYSELDKDIKVTIDYINATSEQNYTVSKEDFLSKDRTINKWNVSVIDRTPPLVYINDYAFDVSHAKDRLIVINDVLNS
jgi:hypothetical protein